METTTMIIIFVAVLLLAVLIWSVTKKQSAVGSLFKVGRPSVKTAGCDTHEDEDYTGAYCGGRQRELRIFAQEPWFAEMKSGRKVVEARVGDPEFYKKNIGQPAVIKVPGGEDHKVVIKDVRHHASLDKYIEQEDLKKYAPHLKTKAEAKTAYLSLKDKAGTQIFSPARVTEKGGITVLELGPHH